MRGFSWYLCSLWDTIIDQYIMLSLWILREHKDTRKLRLINVSIFLYQLNITYRKYANKCVSFDPANKTIFAYKF